MRPSMSDVDGTLVTDDKTLTDATREAVRRIKRARNFLRDHQRPPAARSAHACRVG